MNMEVTVNNKPYSVLRLLGKGKGGYSYLVTDGQKEYVLKQIHHEPCDYYQFGDKLQSELMTMGGYLPLVFPCQSCWKQIMSRSGF